MPFYFVTGKLGNGKSLVSVSRIQDKIRSGCKVATNIDLNLISMFGPVAKNINAVRVPDKPTVFDLQAIGNGNDTYDESKNGLLVLDECGTWFNSRNWQDKARLALNDWFLHARKLGWDVILIVQNISIIDSQARDALSEHVAYCRRMDNFQIPFVGGLYKALTGSRLKLPKVHVARVVYGSQQTDPLADRWVYRGTALYSAYDTKQTFLADYPHGAHCLLTPWHLTRHYRAKRDMGYYMRLTKIYWKKLRAPLGVTMGIVFGIVLSFFMTAYANDRFFREYQELQKTIQRLETLGVNSPPPPNEVSDQHLSQFDGWRIVGYSRYSDRVYYDLQPPAEDKKIGLDEELRVVSSRDLTSYDIRPVSPCHMRIGSGSAFTDIFCF
jgi:hypothetical protein